MFDADEPGTIVNEFLITLFIPGIVLFTALWASFQLVFDTLLLSVGLPPIVPAGSRNAIAAGYGRFLLLVVITTALLVPYIAVYRRVIRGRLRRRGLV